MANLADSSVVVVCADGADTAQVAGSLRRLDSVDAHVLKPVVNRES